MGKNGKRNSVQVGQGRARRWMVLTARWSAALLCAYVPLADQLAPLMPTPLLNILALLAGLHALLPLDGTPPAVPTREAASPVCRSGSERWVRTADTCRPVRAVGSPWAVARLRGRKRLDGPKRAVHTTRNGCTGHGARTDCSRGRRTVPSRLGRGRTDGVPRTGGDVRPHSDEGSV